ncbi:DUF58 domain-containing protein [Bacillus cereus]|uniref:DUF58 domain-containing protein n=1 Tax=Bacillus cereus TaxID=1396 RepID=UPI00356CC399
MLHKQRIVTIPVFFQPYIIKLTIPITLLFFLVFPNQIALFFFFIYYLLAIALYFYVFHVEKNLQITNEKKLIRLFPTENGTLSILVHNAAKLPIVNGKITFRTADLPLINKKTTCNHHSFFYEQTKLNGTSSNIFTFPFTQKSESVQQWNFTFQATTRGCFHIENLEYMIGDPFNLIHVHSSAIHDLKTELLVYPIPKPVVGLHIIFQTNPGTYYTNFSFYQDESTIIGIKPYEKESFRSIHWKASAKMQQLHVKQYQPILNHSWSICLCLSYDTIPDWNIHMEDLISFTAFICQTAAEKNIPFELFISILSDSKPLHIPINKGIDHYAQVLENLARIKQKNILLPKNRFIHYFINKCSNSSSLIFIGVNKKDIPSAQQPIYLVTDKGVVE